MVQASNYMTNIFISKPEKYPQNGIWVLSSTKLDVYIERVHMDYFQYIWSQSLEQFSEIQN